MIDGYFHSVFLLVIDEVVLTGETNHLYLFVKQLCFCLYSRASFFMNSNAMVSKWWIMGSDNKNDPTP